MIVRAVRIVAIAVALPLLFALSARVSEAQHHEPIPGLSWALGVVSVLFLVRAVVTEWSQGAAANVQKDVLWGASLGGILTILSRC